MSDRKDAADHEIAVIANAVNNLFVMARGLPQLTKVEAIEVALHKVEVAIHAVRQSFDNEDLLHKVQDTFRQELD